MLPHVDDRRIFVSYAAPGVAAPLVVDLHAVNLHAAQEKLVSGMDAIARAEGWHAIWPEGFRGSWNAGPHLYDPAAAAHINHTAEILAHIQWAAARVPVTRVFVTGISNGCAEAHRFAFEASDRVDGVVCVAHSASPGIANGSRPVPALIITGALDEAHASDEQMRVTMAKWSTTNRCHPDEHEHEHVVNVSHHTYTVTDWLGCAAALRHVRFRPPYGHYRIVDNLLPPELSVAAMAREFWRPLT